MEEEFPVKGRKETLGSDGNILYLDYGNGYTGYMHLSKFIKLHISFYFYLFFKINLFIYLFLPLLGVRCCVQAFKASGGYSS